MNIIITNKDEFSRELREYLNKKLKIMGELIVAEIRKKIKDMNLIDTTEFWSSFSSHVEDGVLTIESSVGYAVYLEYGTFEYFDRYGLKSFPTAKIPKKKDISRELAEKFPKGMMPFAPVRRVLYNKKLMENIISKAFNS